MATLLSKATGNLSDATATWGLVDSTSYTGGTQDTSSHTVTTAYSGTRTVGWTATAGDYDGIAVVMGTRTATTGTITVHLCDAGFVEIPGTAVTINVSDLPASVAADNDGGWIFFKFAAPVTLAAATTYLEVRTSSASQVSLWRSNSTVGNIRKALRRTTEQAPAAGDDLIITKQWTAAATGTDVVITMDNTETAVADFASATDFGAASTSVVTPAIAICQGGTLQFGATAATNYVLRVSGHMIVYSGGTFSMGTTGTPCPRDSTMALGFDCAADGDVGLTIRNLGTCNMQGQSRTSGKNVVQTLLTSDVTQKTASVTCTSATPMVVTWTSNTLGNGDRFQFTGGTAPTGLALNTTYYVVNNAVDGAGKFRLAATSGGADLASSSTGATLAGWATSDVSVEVADDTGWLSGDIIALAGTNRPAASTNRQHESTALSANAGATTLTFANGLVFGRSGTSPTQAEVILLTRNVIVSSVDTTKQGFMDIRPNATVDLDWVRFTGTGSSVATTKGAIWYGVTTGSFSCHYCAVDNTRGAGVYNRATTDCNNITISDLVLYDNNTTATSSHGGFYLNESTALPPNITLSNITSIAAAAGSTTAYASLTINCAGAQMSGLRAANHSRGTGISVSSGTKGQGGTLSNCVSHSNTGTSGYGFLLAVKGMTVSNVSSWRNAIDGFVFGNPASITLADTIISGLTAFGNSSDNISFSGGVHGVVVNDALLYSESAFTTPQNITFQDGYTTTDVIFNSPDFIGPGIAATYDIRDLHTNADAETLQCIFVDANVAGTTVIAGITGALLDDSYVAFQSYDRVAGDHRIYTPLGTILSDTTIYDTTPSIRMTPSDATYELKQTIGRVNVNSGQAATPSVKVRESLVSAGDANTYDGNRVKLYVKANHALGITADTLLDTATASSEGAWETLTGATAAASEDGVMEFYVTCDGTTGWVNVDTLTATVA